MSPRTESESSGGTGPALPIRGAGAMGRARGLPGLRLPPVNLRVRPSRRDGTVAVFFRVTGILPP